MPELRSIFPSLLALFVFSFLALPSFAHGNYLILVDKKSQRRGVDPKCYLISHSVGQFYLKKVYNAVCGKSGGRKNFEGDLKTPEGKYVVISKIHTGRSSKYGPLFLKLNYPNNMTEGLGELEAALAFTEGQGSDAPSGVSVCAIQKSDSWETMFVPVTP